jgi:hypothetical protein
MTLDPVKRSHLVDWSSDPNPPKPPDIGITIHLNPAAAGDSYRSSEPIVLRGAFRANGVLLKKTNYKPRNAIFVVLTNESSGQVITLPLVVSKALVVSPNETEQPTVSDTFRQGGQFLLDLRKFFELADAPARYRVQAKIDSYLSEELRFSLLPPG